MCRTLVALLCVSFFCVSYGTHIKNALVIIMGLHRGGPIAWTSIFKHLIGPLNADLAVFTPVQYFNSFLTSKAQYVWTFDEPKSWRQALRVAAQNCTDWETYLCDKTQRLCMASVQDCWDGSRGSDGVQLAMRWMLSQKLIETQVHTKYEWFIITRSDLLFLCDHRPIHEFDPIYLWIPQASFEQIDGEDVKFSDKHLVVSRENLQAALNTTTQILCEPQQYRKQWTSPPYTQADIEVALFTTWRDQGLEVRRFPRHMFTVMQSHDQSRFGWLGIGHIHPQYNVHLKAPYYEEMIQAQANCHVLVNSYLDSVAFQNLESEL